MFSVAVSGVPRPQGSKQAFKRGAHIVLVESSKGLPAWRQAIVETIKQQNHPQFQESVSVKLAFFFARPKTVKRKDMTVAPDIDKLCRAVLDALTISGIIIDDSYVIRLEATKHYAENSQPGVYIEIDTPHAQSLAHSREQTLG